jgi:opacity protein-like surface antigen
MILFRGLVTIAFVLGVSASTLAQSSQSQGTFSALPEEPEGFTVTPFLGLGFAGDLENSPTTFGVAAGFGLSERLSLEGDVYWAPGGEQGPIVALDTSVWSVSGNVLYHFTAENFTPYIVGGVGVMGADTNAEELGLEVDDTDTKFAWNWGAGVKSALSERIGLRADLRFFNGDELVPDHWRLVGGVIIRRIGR